MMTTPASGSTSGGTETGPAFHIGSLLRHGYFQPVMDNGFKNPWGYEEDILLVRDAGVRLGLICAPAGEAATEPGAGA